LFEAYFIGSLLGQMVTTSDVPLFKFLVIT